MTNSKMTVAEALEAVLAWIDAVPSDTVLPAMPGFDRDLADSALQDAQRGATPPNRWAAAGEPDPHGTRYDCPREALGMGNLTDDELANEVYMWGDHQPSLDDILTGKAKSSMTYLTAAKDRIRWLSRQLTAALACNRGLVRLGEAAERHTKHLEGYKVRIAELHAVTKHRNVDGKGERSLLDHVRELVQVERDGQSAPTPADVYAVIKKWIDHEDLQCDKVGALSREIAGLYIRAPGAQDTPAAPQSAPLADDRPERIAEAVRILLANRSRVTSFGGGPYTDRDRALLELNATALRTLADKA